MTSIEIKDCISAASRVLIGADARTLDYADRLIIALPLREELSVDYLCARTFLSVPRWMEALVALRNLLVSAFGLRTKLGDAPPPLTRDIRFEPGGHDCFFAVIDRTDEEIVMAESDKHLDFRVSVRKEMGPSSVTTLELTTVVWYRNWLGPVYFTVVKPFHRLLLRRMARRLVANLEREFGLREPASAASRAS